MAISPSSPALLAAVVRAGKELAALEADLRECCGITTVQADYVVVIRFLVNRLKLDLREFHRTFRPTPTEVGNGKPAR